MLCTGLLLVRERGRTEAEKGVLLEARQGRVRRARSQGARRLPGLVELFEWVAGLGFLSIVSLLSMFIRILKLSAPI